MRTGVTAAGAAMLFLTMGTVAWADDAPKCQLARFANLPATIEPGGRMTVPATIKGQPLNMLLDTGSYITLLTDSASNRLGLRQTANPRIIGMFYGGIKSNHVVETNDMVFGRIKLPNMTLMILPGDPSDFDGVIGDNLLAVFDVELDIAAGTVNLFSQTHCPGKVVYWSKGSHAEIPFKLDENIHIRFDVEIDGKTVPAMLDTGAAYSIISQEYAKYRFGIKDSEIKDGKYPFKVLSFGGVDVKNPDMRIVSNEESQLVGESGQPKLIVGMNMLRWLHLYIAYKEHIIYATAAGAH